MSQPFLGQLMLFGGNFAPLGWNFCDGSIVAIANNDALFSLIGTSYGGDGQTTFALPDLRGRVAMGMGQGPGLANYSLAQQGGVESVTLTATQLPAHTHPLTASGGAATSPFASGNTPALSSTNVYHPGAPVAVAMSSQSCGAAGGNGSHDNMQPSLVLNWVIAMEGIYPSQQ